MQSRKKLATEVFNLDLFKLEVLASKATNYRVFDIQQGTKTRQVETPKPVLERLHRRLLVLLERIEKPDYLHSGVKGRSYISNAKSHLGSVPLFKIDLKRFYPSVDAARVYRFFNQVLKCSPDVSALLTRLLTHDGHVPTGSCVSQLLAFFAAKSLFDDLMKLSEAHEVTFTCYVDDLTFSGQAATPALLWEVKKIIHSHGFRYHKERVYGANQRKLVTGAMIVGDALKVLPSREHNIWRMTHMLGSVDLEDRLEAVRSLIGHVIAAGQVEQRLLARLKRLRLMQAQYQKEAAAVNA